MAVMRVVDNLYELGQIVYLKTDTDQRERIVTAFCVGQGYCTYQLKAGTCDTWHYGFEIATEKNTLITTTN